MISACRQLCEARKLKFKLTPTSCQTQQECETLVSEILKKRNTKTLPYKVIRSVMVVTISKECWEMNYKYRDRLRVCYLESNVGDDFEDEVCFKRGRVVTPQFWYIHKI